MGEPLNGGAVQPDHHTSAPPSTAQSGRDSWEKIDIIGKLSTSILIPLAVVLAGYFVNSALQRDNATQKAFEIAVDVLRSTNPPPQLKVWAEKVFADTLSASGSPLSDAARQELQTNPLPAGITNPKPAEEYLTELEGFSATPRALGNGLWVIGYGHVQGVGPNTPPITPDEAQKLLKDDLEKMDAVIDDKVKARLSANQRDALRLVVWFAGAKRLVSLGIAESLSSGDYQKVGELLKGWQTANDLPGIAKIKTQVVLLWSSD